MQKAGLIAPLFVPADRPERFRKAAGSGADAIIIDLEDAVSAGEKAKARSNLALALTLDLPVYVRINASGTPWYEQDLDALKNLDCRQICLPKADSAESVDAITGRLGGHVEILAQIETAKGLQNLSSVAAHPNISQLAFGPADFFLDMRTANSAVLTEHVLMVLAVASRAAGKPLPLDGPAFAIGDQVALIDECRTAAAAGAGGKLCIHPSQIQPVLTAFAPDAEQVAWAKRVVAADRDGSAQMVDGRMIDAPIVAMARAILDRDSGRPLIVRSGNRAN